MERHPVSWRRFLLILDMGHRLISSSMRFLIIFFCYFYVPYVFKPDDVADNLRKNGGFLPGIRPGQRTAEYLILCSVSPNIYRRDLCGLCLCAPRGLYCAQR